MIVQLLRSRGLLRVLVAAFSLPFAQTLQAEQWGDLAGQVTVSGYIAAPPKVLAPKEVAQCGTNILDESLLINQQTAGLANVFIYLKAPPSRVHPDLLKTAGPVTVHSEGCRFAPHAILARTQQPIRFVADDSFMHHIRAISFTNPAVSKTVTENQIGTFQFAHPTRFPMRARCDFHYWMEGLWLVLDHPYAAITDEAGFFQIPKLPVGEHTFIVWHERCGYIKREWNVTISPGTVNRTQPLNIDISKLTTE